MSKLYLPFLCFVIAGLGTLNYALKERDDEVAPIRNYSIMTTNQKARLAIIIQDETFDHTDNLVAEKIENGKSYILVKTDGVIYKDKMTDVYQDENTEEYKLNSKVIECYTTYWGEDENRNYRIRYRRGSL